MTVHLAINIYISIYICMYIYIEIYTYRYKIYICMYVYTAKVPVLDSERVVFIEERSDG